MKCRICGKKAVIHLRQHNLALCRDHFLERFERETLRVIRRYQMFTREERVAVAVSGGKDSLGLLYLLHKHGFQVEGLFLDLGIRRGLDYSSLSRQRVEAFRDRFGIPIHIVSIQEETGKTVPEWARKRRERRVCRVCGMLKRYYLNKTAYERGFRVIATGHNLDDEVATLLGNTLRWDFSYLVKQGPVLPSPHPKLARRVKPFAFFTEKETALYAILQGIEYVEVNCPFSEGAKSRLYKHVLNDIEVVSPGTKLRFYQEFLRFQREHLATSPEEQYATLRECRICGMPTNLDVCAVCRLRGLDKVQAGTSNP